MAAKKSSGPTAEQTDIAKNLASLMERMVSINTNLERSFNNQTNAMKEMAQSMEKMGQSDVVTQLSQVNDTLKKISESLDKLQSSSSAAFSAMASQTNVVVVSAHNLSDAIGNIGKEAEKVKKDPFQDLLEELQKTGSGAKSLQGKIKGVGTYLQDKFPKSAAAAIGAVHGFTSAISDIAAVGTSALGFLASFASAAWEIGKSILAIPFKMFSGLIDMANKGGGGISELAQAINHIRKEFGALKDPVSSTIMSVGREMKGFNGAGVSAFGVFGNVAERMEMLIKLFSAGGPAIQNFTKEFKEAGGALMGYQRGLGLTDEQMGEVAQRATVMGTSMGKVLNDITKQSLTLGKTFGLNAKLISKDMGKAMQDVKHFATLTAKEIGVASTYARKLGLDLDKITGTLDAFETFDSAAENVSKLNEAFGTNIEAAALMNAQNPAEQLDILRKSFRSAGVDGEKLSRAQLKLISQNTQLDEGTIRMALSSKNAGVSLDKIKKAGDRAETSAMSQTQAMSKLADAMERTLKAGQAMQGGFFDQFIKGIFDGLQTTKEFRELMMNIKQAMVVVYQEGRKLGMMLMDVFPGLKYFAQGLADLFKPAKFKRLFGGISEDLVSWMRTLDGPNGEASFPQLMDNLQKRFFDFFNSETPAGSKLISGFSKIMNAISKTLGGAMTWVLQKVTGFVQDLTGFINDPWKVPGTGKAKTALETFFAPIMNSLRSNGPQLIQALTDLLNVVLDKVGGWLWDKGKELLADHWGKLLIYVAGKTGVSVGWTIMTTVIQEKIKQAIVQGAATAAAEKSAQAAVSQLGNAVANAAQSAGATGIAEGGSAASAAAGSTFWSSALSFATTVPTAAAAGAAAAVGVALAGVLATGYAAWSAYEANDLQNEIQSKFEDITTAGINAASKNATKEAKVAAIKQTDEFIKAQEKAIKDRGMGAELIESLFGTEGNSMEDLVAKAKRQRDDLVAQTQKLDEEAAKKLKEEQRKQSLIDAMGPITVENAAEKFKKIDDLSKQVMAKDFNLQDKINGIKSKLDSIDWNIIDKSKEDSFNKVVLQIDSLRAVMGGITDIGILSKKAGDQLSAAGKSFDTLSAMLGAGGAVRTTINNAIETFASRTVNAETTDAASKASTYSAAMMVDVANLSKRMNEVASYLGDQSALSGIADAMKTTVKDTLTSIIMLFYQKEEIFSNTAKGIAQVNPMLMSFQTFVDTFGGLLPQLTSLNSLLSKGIDLTPVAIAANTIAGFMDTIAPNVSYASDAPAMFSTFSTAVGSVVDFATNFSALQSQMISSGKQIESKMQDFGSSLSGITGVFATGGVLRDFIDAYGQDLSSAFVKTSEVIAVDATKSVKAVSKMVDAADALSKALERGKKIDIAAKMKSFTSALGTNIGSAGSKSDYTVGTKDVNLTVNFRIAMDTYELEKVIVSKKDSLVKNRINLLIDAVQKNSTDELRNKLNSGKFGDTVASNGLIT